VERKASRSLRSRKERIICRVYLSLVTSMNTWYFLNLFEKKAFNPEQGKRSAIKNNYDICRTIIKDKEIIEERQRNERLKLMVDLKSRNMVLGFTYTNL